MAVNSDWALGKLDAFLQLTALKQPGSRDVISPARSNVGSLDEIVKSAQVVEQILARVLPDWRTEVPDDRNRRVNRWCQHREAVQRAQVVITEQAEIDENLGENAPTISAAALHPWVWDGARSLWQSRHFRQAVGAAAAKVNAETQNKIGSRRLSESDLFQHLFSTDPPTPDQPRLRLVADDDPKTFRSMHSGASAFARGCYAAMRNVAAHGDPNAELPEHVALEQLAAFSVLARWVDAATVERA